DPSKQSKIMTFRRFSILCGIVAIFLIFLDLMIIDIPFVLFPVLAVIYIGISFGMAFKIESGFFMKAVCRGNPDRKEIILSFDDGPDPITTPVILDILKRNGVPATFFCIGKKIPGHEALLKRIIQEGHIIGNHSYSHAVNFDFFSSDRIRKELKETGKIIKEATGKSTLIFRPPYGVINPLLKKAIDGSGLTVVGYSNRVYDTSVKKPGKILSRFQKNLKPGDIVLLHDTIPATASMLQKIIDHTKASGYRIVPIHESANISIYEE
ncbi:MAG: polysaccharide deacetylase family protein, partial [Bacteroidota bacterium]|nr:polysaccharide deacetylase family protein [Bacteroidota bacterium]